MRRSYFVLLTLLGLIMALMVPVTAAGAAQSDFDLQPQKVTVEASPSGSYIVVMTEAPLIVEYGQEGLTSKKAEKEARGVAKGHDTVLAAAGVDSSAKLHSYTSSVNGFAAVMTQVEAQKIADRDDVFAVYIDELRQPTTDESGTFLGLDGPAGAWSLGYDGEGVVIGIIDSGIWPEHPSFADDGSYSDLGITLDDSVYSACDFGNVAHHPEDAAFDCNNKLIGARQVLPTYRSVIGANPDEFDSARDENGHGSHTASTAAGNSGVEASILGVDRGVLSGVAPRASVIAYKALGSLGGFGSDLAAAIDQAVTDGVDVINYSIGSGSYAIGPDDIAFLFAAAAGVHVATSNGNNGPGAATTGSPASVPWLTSVGASTQARTFQGAAVLGDGSEYFGASVTAGTEELKLVDAADAGDALCNKGALDPGIVDGNIVLCLRGAIARVEKGEAVDLAGGAGMILYNANDAQSQVTDTHFVPAVHINNTDGLAVKAYIASEGGDAVATINGGVYTPAQGSVMAAFSSRGPNLLSSDIIKPDVTAPGVNILAAMTPVPEAGSVSGELFQSISGTSMSSPHVAGLFALIKQAHPDWTPAMAKSALMTTSRQDVFKEDGATAADAFDMGAGHVDLGETVHKGSAFQPGLVYDAGLFEYAAFSCGAEMAIFTPGSCDFLASIGVPSDGSDLNLASIGVGELAGSQTVTRSVTSVAQDNGKRTYTVSVDAPAGFDVEVSPAQLTLKSGQSATYEVMFTANGTMPVGVWSQGSLTWTERNSSYSVYSPIAVRGASFDSPGEITGSGTSGSASFPVNFGYTGDYTAAPHGLVADAPVSDVSTQDPDQTYPSGDDAPNGVNRHDFVVTDSAYVRWSLVIPGDDDLDLFLENSSGAIIATSTNGGTDELIELFLPGDDTYTMVVHGWSVPNAPLPYTMSFFDIPLTPGGGTLHVDSAPASATVGTVGTIDISWSGLDAGNVYLGAVSHSDASGLMGLTYVQVNS